MFELGDLLVGIYKTNNITKSITINPKKVLEKIENEKKNKDVSNITN